MTRGTLLPWRRVSAHSLSFGGRCMDLIHLLVSAASTHATEPAPIDLTFAIELLQVFRHCLMILYLFRHGFVHQNQMLSNVVLQGDPKLLDIVWN